MAGPDAGFTANGTLLDIDDRQGGSLYIGGSGDGVILTSLADDTAAAGVDFFGGLLAIRIITAQPLALPAIGEVFAWTVTATIAT